jgi:hypothetical protein
MADREQTPRGMRGRMNLRSSGMFSSNPQYRAPGTEGGRPFQPTEHLAPEAISAFVDGELRMSAHMRAAHHLSVCRECAAEVDQQRAARTALRKAGEISIPSDLLGALGRIPTQEIDLRRDGRAAGNKRPRKPASPLDAPGFPIHRRKSR